MTSDDDVRRVLSVLDEIEPAPQALVDRVWGDVASLLDDGDARTVVRMRASESASRGPARSLGLVAASVAAIIALGVVVGLGRSTDRVAVSDPSLASVPATTEAVTTEPAADVPTPLGDVCAALPAAGELPGPLVLSGPAEVDADLLGDWASYVDAIVGAVDDLGQQTDASDQLRSLRLLRSALISARTSRLDDDDRGFATALDNVDRHLTAAVAGPIMVSSCLLGLTFDAGS